MLQDETIQGYIYEILTSLVPHKIPRLNFIITSMLEYSNIMWPDMVDILHIILEYMTT